MVLPFHLLQSKIILIALIQRTAAISARAGRKREILCGNSERASGLVVRNEHPDPASECNATVIQPL
jgi:hypothetical protein